MIGWVFFLYCSYVQRKWVKSRTHENLKEERATTSNFLTFDKKTKNEKL